jgi:putative inorganic carbon (HCO3(-)) transporter
MNQKIPSMKTLSRPNFLYLLQEAVLFLLVSYLITLGGTYNGLVLFPLQQMSTVLIFVLGAAWLAWRFWRTHPFPATRLDWPVLAVAAAGILVTLTSADPRRSAITLVQLGVYILVFYCLVDLLRHGLPEELLVKVLLLTSLVVFFFVGNQVFSWFRDWIAIAGWGHPIPPVSVRASALFGSSNLLAAYLNLLLPLGIMRAFQSRTWLTRLAWLLWGGVALFFIFFTSSRGGWYGTAAALGLLVVLLGIEKRRVLKTWWAWLLRRKLLLGLAGVAVVSLLIAGFVLVDWQLNKTIHAGSGLDASSRTYIWIVAWDTFRTHLVFGNGPFTFGPQFMQAYSVPPDMLLAHAHNFIFNIAAEAGLVGVAAFGWLIVAFVIVLWRKWKAVKAQDRLGYIGVIAAIGGLAVHSLFETPELLPAIGIILISLAAVAVARNTGDLTHPGSGSQTAFKAGKWVPPVLWLVVVAALGWNVWAYQPASAGANAANQNDWKTGAQELDLAVVRDPGLALNWMEAGYAHGVLALNSDGTLKDAKVLAQALSDYQRGMAIEPVYATNWANFGVLEWVNGNHAAALQALKRAAETAIRQPAFLLTYGRMLEADGQLQAAQQAYRQVLDAAPSWIDSYFFRATPFRATTAASWKIDANQTAGSSGTPAASINSLQSAGFGLEDGGSMASNQFDLGLFYSQQGQTAQAIQSYESGLHILDATTSFGIGEMNTSQYAWYVFYRESIAQDLLPGIDYVIYTDGVVQSMLDLAQNYRKMGDATSAIRIYNKIIQVAPDNKTALSQLSELSPK